MNVVATSSQISVDITPPTIPLNLIATTTATSTGVSSILSSWTSSTDDVGVLGYSFLWDTSSSTVPDAITETGATSTVTLLPDGVWYLHVLAVDSSLNLSPVATFGPLTLTTILAGDTVPPIGPTLVTSSTHTVDSTSSVQTTDVSWDTATDDVALAGYSYLWDTNASTTPDTVTESTLLTSSSFLPTGIWYFHVRSVDSSGNGATTTAHFGPVIIVAATSSDVLPPIGPTLVTSSTHTVGVDSATHLVDVQWDDASDETALAGYSYSIDTIATGTPDNIVDTQATSTSSTLPDGNWFFHVQAVDVAGNIGPVITFGPLQIVTSHGTGDTAPPSVPVVTFIKTSTSTLSASWADATDNIAVAGYSTLFSTNASSSLDSIIETNGTSTSVVVPDGIWYFHIASVDTSLNTSSVVSNGPIVVDTHPPVLTLIGRSVMSIATGTLFNDPGVQAFDTIEGDISGNVVASGTVDISTVGTYIITYNVSDTSLNTATSVSRTVHVIGAPDVTPPVITLNGSSTITIFQGGVFTDAGATALDAVDGDVTSYLSVSGTVDTTIIGTYTVVYSVSDSSGNNASTTRTIQVVPLIFHTINASVVGQGTLSPSGTSTLLEGTSQTYSIIPNHGYEVTDLLIDGTTTATSTSYTFNNILVDHTIQAIFTALPSRPTFTIIASSSPNGTITPNATSTVLQGDDLAVVITPDVGYYIGTLLVDGVSIATTTPYTFSNVNADHTIEATFVAYPPDAIPPTSVVVNSSSHAVNIPSQNLNLSLSWTSATDVGSGVAGYSFVLDNATTTDPDVIVDTVATSTTQALATGSWYFHIRSVDNVGNTSATAHFGPILISDGTVLLLNSFIDGTHFTSYAPTLASSTALGITGTTTITNSNLISPFTITDSVLTNVTASSSQLTYVAALNSFFYNSALSHCTVTNSFLKNYTGSNCIISDSILDPVGQTNDVTGSTISNFSSLFASDVLYSIVSGSYIATSTITGSTFTNSTSTLSTVASSTLHDTDVISSILSGVTIAPSATSVIIASSSLHGTTILGTSTSITHSTLGNTTITNAVVIDDVIYSGIVLLPSGTSTLITTPTPVTAIINVAPVIHIATSTAQGTLTITDSSTDGNATTTPYLHDSWVYVISYGDGTQSTSSAGSLGTIFTHTYTTSGTYLVTVTVIDAYGASTSYSTNVTVIVPVVSGGGGGSGGGSYSGGGWFIYSAPNATTTYSTSTHSIFGTSSLPMLIKRPTGKVAGVSTSTKKLSTKKVVTKTLKKKSVTKNISQQVQENLPVIKAEKTDTNSGGFWAHVSSIVSSLKETLGKRLGGIVEGGKK